MDDDKPTFNWELNLDDHVPITIQAAYYTSNSSSTMVEFKDSANKIVFSARAASVKTIRRGEPVEPAVSEPLEPATKPHTVHVTHMHSPPGAVQDVAAAMNKLGTLQSPL